MKHSIYLYVFLMALVTYLIRVLPLTLIRREIKSSFIKSFLYYVPYVTLATMTFPAILTATDSIWSGAVGFLVALVLAYKGRSLIQVSMLACVCVFFVELFLC